VNINLPAALLSRFDLLFILVDKAENKADKRLAEHVTYVHAHNQPRPVDRSGYLSPEFIRAYIGQCKEINTTLPVDLVD